VVPDLPDKPLRFVKTAHSGNGETYVMSQPRAGTIGYDVFMPIAGIDATQGKLAAAAEAVGACVCGPEALEVARIEAGIPRFGIDMDETNFPQECGIEERAVTYTKGCYIGQEVLNRIHTMGHVNRTLCALRLAEDLAKLPVKGDRLFAAEKEVGHITSAATLPGSGKNVALALVRKEAADAGAELTLRNAAGDSSVIVESRI
jgi:folate-binding protein YgfZ